MGSGFSVVVIGDLNFEVISELDEHAFAHLNHDVLACRPIRPTIGGTAANFALAGRNLFRTIDVIGKVGDDPLGALILSRLAAEGIRLCAAQTTASPTGLTINLSDASSSQPTGIRLLVVHPDSANETLTTADVNKHEAILRHCALLVLDGYCMLSQPRRDASLKAMQIAHSGGAVIAFDIVPHEAYTLYKLEELQFLVNLADVIITEVGTMHGFLVPGVQRHFYDLASAMEILEKCRKAFPGKTFLLRFGVRNVEESLICVPNRDYEYRNYAKELTPDGRGLGDRITALELSEILPYLLKDRTTKNDPSATGRDNAGADT